MISKTSTENIVGTASPQVVNQSCLMDSEPMEMEIQDSYVKVVKANQHLVKLSLKDEPENYNIILEKVKKVIFDEMKTIYITIYFHKKERSICCTFENGETARAFANFDFKRVEIDCHTKMLTDNSELDKRKIKLVRPSTGRLNVTDLKSSLCRFGEIDEFYEIHSNERKRTFVIAFKDDESKMSIIQHEHIFLGSNILKVEDYVKGINENHPQIERLTLRISNIPASTTEYNIKPLMENMKCSFWHIPVAKNGYKMKCVIAQFKRKEDLQNAMRHLWEFQNRKLVLTDPNTKCCFTCGHQEHLASDCPKKIITSGLRIAREQLPIFRGQNWKELSLNIIEKMTKKPNVETKHTKNINDDLLQELLRDNMETKKRLKQLEDENMQLKETLTSFKEEISEKIHDTYFKAEEAQHDTNSKIDNLCLIVGDLTKAVQAVMERINLEPISQKAKKTKSIDCDDKSQ